MLALAVAILLIFRDAVLSEIFNKNEIGDTVREIRGDPALQVVRVDEGGDQPFARGDDYRVSPSEERQLQNISNPPGSLIFDRVRKESVLAGRAIWRIYLRGGRNESVQVLDIRPVNVKRVKPLAGALFWNYSQGETDIPQIGIDMDSPRPEAREIVDDKTWKPYYRATLGKPYFYHKALSLNNQEDLLIALSAYSQRYWASFDLQIDYMVGNDSRRETITDNGRPFSLTGFNCQPNGTLDYKHYYLKTGFNVDGKEDPTGPDLGLAPEKSADEDAFFCARDK